MAARRIRIPNELLTKNETTYLDADYSSGTTLTVVSNLGFSANNIVVVGRVGDEKTEGKSISSTTGNTTITLSSSLKFTHNRGLPLYQSLYNQVVIERATTQYEYTVLATIDIQWDKLETLYTDSTGSTAYWYRFRFYNDVTGSYSAYSPTQTGAGFSRQQVGTMLQNVRRKIDDPNRVKVRDTDIIRKLADGQSVLEAVRHNWWFLYYDSHKAGNGIATVASTARYSLAQYTDLNYIERVKFHYNDGLDSRIYELEPKDEIEFDYETINQDRSEDDNVSFFKLLPPDSSSNQGYIVVEPIPETSAYGTIYPLYYKKFTTLDDIADSTECPLPEVLEDYACWRIFQERSDEQRAEIYRKLFYGPSAQDKDRQPLTGIALLEQMNKNKGIATGMPKSLWRYRGTSAVEKYFTTRYVDTDELREKYF